MRLRYFKPASQRLIFFILGCLLPFVAKSAPDEEVLEKRIKVAMRMIGHEVLTSLGDCESRVMPIEKIDQHYKIPFESKLKLYPDDIVFVVKQVMAETGAAKRYLVEVEQCEKKEVVHSFEIRNEAYTGLIPCEGRLLPEDCYSLLITILDGTPLNLPQITTAIELPEKSNPLKSPYLTVPLLFLIGFIAYLTREKHPADSDPNLILIGASQFDKRSRVLSFEGHRLELSHKEAELLLLLHASANAPIEREVILQKVWGDEGDYVGRTLDVFISKLRKRLEADASVKIINIRGVGYQLVMED